MVEATEKSRLLNIPGFLSGRRSIGTQSGELKAFQSNLIAATERAPVENNDMAILAHVEIHTLLKPTGGSGFTFARHELDKSRQLA